MQQVCAVCELLDGDKALKDCFWCKLCDKWICLADKNRWDRRAKAMLKWLKAQENWTSK